MATVGPIHLTLSCDTSAASASLRSIADVLAATGGRSEAVAQFFDESGVLRDDLGDLILVEPVNAGAAGTRKLEAIKLNPSDWYLEFVAALTREGNAHTVGFVHGWPILSTVARTSVVAEAGGVASAPGEGAAGPILELRKNLEDIVRTATVGITRAAQDSELAWAEGGDAGHAGADTAPGALASPGIEGGNTGQVAA